jgi:hypothetical protein
MLGKCIKLQKALKIAIVLTGVTNTTCPTYSSPILFDSCSHHMSGLPPIVIHLFYGDPLLKNLRTNSLRIVLAVLLCVGKNFSDIRSNMHRVLF